jgi:hypothetical protein
MRSAVVDVAGPQRHVVPARSHASATQEHPPFLSFAKPSSEQQREGSPSETREHAISVPLGLSRESQSHRTPCSTEHFTIAAGATDEVLDSEHAAMRRSMARVIRTCARLREAGKMTIGSDPVIIERTLRDRPSPPGSRAKSGQPFAIGSDVFPQIFGAPISAAKRGSRSR